MKLLMFYQNVIPESPYYEFEANQYVTDKCQTVCTSLGYVPIFQQKGAILCNSHHYHSQEYGQRPLLILRG
jgi:hypothetical protein